MEEVSDSLFVGDENDCHHGSEIAVVHACKHPCHQNAVGYSGSLPQSHPEYLVSSREPDLYLNIVDMDRKLSHEYTEPIVSATLDFIEEKIESNDVLVHCNKGRSRSPALAMLFLGKRTDEFSDSSYRDAKHAFKDIYPRYQPGRGVEAYLRDYWDELE